MESAPGGLGQLKLLADDYSDKSIDPEDIREDLKTELLTVHAALKQLNKAYVGTTQLLFQSLKGFQRL